MRGHFAHSRGLCDEEITIAEPEIAYDLLSCDVLSSIFIYSGESRDRVYSRLSVTIFQVTNPAEQRSVEHAPLGDTVAQTTLANNVFIFQRVVRVVEI